jgi:hypothetical protein
MCDMRKVNSVTQTMEHKTAKADVKAAKAHAKALRPWFKKKRWWLAIAIVAIIGMAAAGSGSSSDKTLDASAAKATATTAAPSPAAPAGATSSDVRTVSGNKTNPPEADVTIKSCSTDDAGFMTAQLDIVNHSSKASNYMVEVAFEGNGGATQLGTGNAFVSGLEPNQTTAQEAKSLTDATGAFTCRVTSVDRFAA